MALFFFLRRLFSVVYLMTHHAVPTRLKLLPIIAVAYFMSPRDLIPDFVPFIGRLDDLIVIGVLLAIFTTKGWQHVLREQKGKADAIPVEYEVLNRVDQEARSGGEERGSGGEPEPVTAEPAVEQPASNDGERSPGPPTTDLRG